MLGVVDGGFEHIANTQPAVVAQHQHPAIERSRYDGGEEAVAGDQFQALRTIVFDRRRSRRRPLRADHLDLSVLRRIDDGRHVAAWANEMRLDHLQHESRRHRRVKGVAALFQHAHADGGGDPMGRGDDAECAEDFRPGGECAHARLSDQVSRGSSASRSPSPIRLKPMTTR